MFTRILAIPRTQAKDCFCHSRGAERCREPFRGAGRCGSFLTSTSHRIRTLSPHSVTDLCSSVAQPGRAPALGAYLGGLLKPLMA